jgi:hemerythrin
MTMGSKNELENVFHEFNRQPMSHKTIKPKTECIEWDQGLSLGIPLIDAQHKQLVDDVYRFCVSLKHSIGQNSLASKEEESNAIEEILDSLTHYVQTHFSTEEGYFRQFKYDKAKEHIAEHSKFYKKLLEFKTNFDQINESVALETLDYVHHWIESHVLIMDRQYVRCFHDHGL